MPVERKQRTASPAPSDPPPVQADLDSLAQSIVFPSDSPPPRAQKGAGKPGSRPSYTPAPTAFDGHVWKSFREDKYGHLELTVGEIQSVRVRFGRSARFLSHKHQEELRELMSAPPYHFRLSLIVTSKDGKVRLAEGSQKGRLTSPALDSMSSEDTVLLWFRLHVPLNLGRRKAGGRSPAEDAAAASAGRM